VITVYGYGFELPKPAEPPTPWGTYAILAAAAWWLWGKWGKTARQSNPRRRLRRSAAPRRARSSHARGKLRIVRRRRRNPRVRARVGRAVSVPWYGGRVRAKLLKVVGGGRAIVMFPLNRMSGAGLRGNLHNVPTSGLREVK
jgi:hypothetical protein